MCDAVVTIAAGRQATLAAVLSGPLMMSGGGGEGRTTTWPASPDDPEWGVVLERWPGETPHIGESPAFFDRRLTTRKAVSDYLAQHPGAGPWFVMKGDRVLGAFKTHAEASPVYRAAWKLSGDGVPAIFDLDTPEPRPPIVRGRSLAGRPGRK